MKKASPGCDSKHKHTIRGLWESFQDGITPQQRDVRDE